MNNILQTAQQYELDRLRSSNAELHNALELAIATIERLARRHGPFSSVDGTLSTAKKALATTNDNPHVTACECKNSNTGNAHMTNEHKIPPQGTECQECWEPATTSRSNFHETRPLCDACAYDWDNYDGPAEIDYDAPTARETYEKSWRQKYYGEGL